MRLAVNALSCTNLSGPQVVLGHLRELAKRTDGKHEFVVLYNSASRGMLCDLGSNVRWVECPESTAHWTGRALWERAALPRKLTNLGADVLFMSSGTAIGNCHVPQVVLAMNPWCMVPGVHKRVGEKVKAALQRIAYRQAVQKADMMVYCSEYLRGLYVSNAGRDAARSAIAYPGLDNDVLAFLDGPNGLPERKQNRIVCVSRMLPHKNVETVVSAMAVLKKEHLLVAELAIVGAWADTGYERRIRDLVFKLGLRDSVLLKGHLTREELFGEYAEAMVFCLTSTCESFGIPSVEAQAFGTPVVCSRCCAMPEVCGEGGLFVEPGDVDGTANALMTLLRDRSEWERRSGAARSNAARFHYETTHEPLLKMFELERS